MMWYGGWGGWIMMALVMVLFWGGLITAIVLAIRGLSGGGSPQNRAGSWVSPPADDVLAARFARGEIDEDEYRRRITALREHR
jgi:putative membrane protein